MSIEATANFIGKEGFNWWIGQVENDGAGTFWKEVRENVVGELQDVFSGKGFDTSDWDWTNKVKVRIVGYHSPNKADLPTEDLPWALCLMPVTSPQRSGIGGHHQLQINGWVIGFFLDGAAAQIPIVMGAVGDENPVGAYGTEKGSETGFAQLAAPEYDERVHGSSGSGVPGTGNTIETDDNTGLDTASTKSGGKGGEGSTVNPRGGDEQYSASQKAADDAKKVTVQVGNGKCGSETATKLEGPLAEFMKWARGVKQNSIGEYIEEATGDVADMDLKISQTAARIQRKMLGLTANIKGVVMEDVEKMIQDGLNDIGIPDPDADDQVKKKLKDVGDVISCLFKQMLEELGEFIKGILMDLLENVLDTALCLIQDIIGAIMGKIMDQIKGALGMLKNIVGSIKGAADKIQNILSKVFDIIDLFCDGEVSCAIGASVFEVGTGAKKKGNDAKQEQIAQYAFKPPNSGAVVGDGKPKKGFVPFVSGNGEKQIFDTKTGVRYPLDSTVGQNSGITEKEFKTGGPLEKFESLNFYDSNGNISTATVNCSNSILNKKPCFPELVWDNLKSTSPIKALPIVDDIGQILGVFMKRKGSNVGLEAQVRAQFTCNEPEGGGAVLKPIIVDGQVNAIKVIKPGIGYGFDPATTFCPKEQYVVTVPKGDIINNLDDGENLMLVQYADGTVDPTKPDVMQVVDTNFSADLMTFATIDPSWNINLESGVILETKSGYQFTLNFNQKYPELVFPEEATAIYAKCGDLIPIIDNVKMENVGSKYVNPVIVIGAGSKEQEIGTVTVDENGSLVEPKINKKVLGFVKPTIIDRGLSGQPPTGNGGKVIPIYAYNGPRQIKESNILPLQTYIDCVGHPMLVGEVKEETTETLDSTTTTTTVTPSTPTNTDTTTTNPVTTPVNPSTPSTPSNPTPPSNNPPNQGGGGYGY